MKITCIENQKVTVESLSESDLVYLTDPQFKSCFKIRRLYGRLGHELVAENIVGAIKLPSGTHLYVEPKLPVPNLFRMLAYVGELYAPLGRDVEYSKDETLFEVIGQLFASELTRILHRGLKQYYVQDEAPLRSLRGRILFGDSIKKALVGSERMVCRFSNLSLNVPINRAWMTAANVLVKNEAISTRTKKVLRSCLAYLASGAIAADFRLSEFSAISLDRSTDYYQRILFLSRFILESCVFTHSQGEHGFPGFLFDVADLFERYVAKALGEHLPAGNLEVLSQYKTKLDRDGHLTCKPDLTFISTGHTTFIGDTKYKDFSALNFINEDVFQILTYLLRHQCREGVLIYPSFNGKSGIMKTIHIPTAMGDLVVHGLCVNLDSPESVAAQIHGAFYHSIAKLKAT